MSKQFTSDDVIRQLYQITNNYRVGFNEQIKQLLSLGLERFNLDIGILSHVKGDIYSVIACVVPQGAELHAGDSFPFNDTYCSVTCQADAPVAVEHAEKDARFASHPAYKSFALESYIGVPIRVNDKLYGTLNFSSATPYPRAFSDIDIDALQLMASWIGVELVRRAQEKKLAELNKALEEHAYYDSLTNIANRRNMFKHLKRDFNQQLRNSTEGVLAIADIDHFKQLNDSYGHSTGDEALKQVAASLENSIRACDFVARFEGEEFVVWLPDTTEDQSKIVIERIMNQIRSIKVVDKPVTISIGVCAIDFSAAIDYQFSRFVDLALEQADKALYRAKETGRDKACFAC